MVKTYWVDWDEFYENVSEDAKTNKIEVLKKSDVETFGKSFIKTLTIKIHEVGTGTGSEENVKYKNNDLKDGVMLGIKIFAELFQENFKNKLLGSEKDKLDHNDTDSVSQRSSKGLKGIPSEKPKSKLKGEG